MLDWSLKEDEHIVKIDKGKLLLFRRQYYDHGSLKRRWRILLAKGHAPKRV